MEYITSRDVTVADCRWLPRDVEKGTKLFKYTGHTYGVVDPGHIPITFEKDQQPFYAFPENALAQSN